MKILMDTHILLWAVSGDDRLPAKAAELINAEENDLYYSLVSLWETELKHVLHPDLLPVGARELAGFCRESGFIEIPLREAQISELRGLHRQEGEPPHKDPFDRMLICQAKNEGLMLLTHDQLLAGYHEPCVLTV